MLRRLGLRSAGQATDDVLIRTLFTFLDATRAPFEQTFFDWYGGARQCRRGRAAARAPSLYSRRPSTPVRAAMADHAAQPALRLDAAYFGRDRPCTMLIDEVEAIWAPIAQADDWSRLTAKLGAIAEMREAYGTGMATD